MDSSNRNFKSRLAHRRKKLAIVAKRAENVTQKHASRFVFRRMENMRMVMGRMMVWIVFIGLLIAGLGLQYTWNSMATQAVAPQAGGVYVEGVVGDLSTLNPLLATTEPEQATAKLLFSSLYTYDKSGILHTDLAKSMSAKDKKVYTVTLRSAKWSDGEQLTANDVVYTINLIKNPQMRSPLQTSWQDISVRAINSSTVEFELPSQYAGFPHALTFPIVPKHILQNVDPTAMRENDFSNNPIGSGPFIVRRVQSSDSSIDATDVVRMTPNEKYYGDIPRLDRFELHAYQSDELLARAVKNGEVSAAAGLSIDQSNQLASARYTSKHWLLDKGVYILFNVKSELVQEKKVREALRYATNTTEIRSVIGNGVARLDTPILQSQVTEKLPSAPDYNIEKAQTTLKDAGWIYKGGTWRDKSGKDLSITITTASGRDEYTKTVQELKTQWEKLGVKVSIREIDTNSKTTSFVQSVLQPRDYDVLLYELELGADPDEYAYWHSSQAKSSGYNFSNYSNQYADVNLIGGRSHNDMKLRSAKYVQFTKQWLSDVPAIGLYQSVGSYVQGNGVTIVGPTGSMLSMNGRYATVAEWSTQSGSLYKTP